jgi:Flp pilus assembly protein CpaB
MEMEFKDPARRRRFLLVVIGAVLAAAAGLGAFTLASHGSAPVETPKKAVLVASRDIPERTTLTADDVTVRSVPVDEALSQAYLQSTDVVGRVTSVPIYSDQQMTPNLFATAAAGTDFSILGPDDLVTADSPTWRAVAISIPNDRAVGGEVKAGDHVDLFVSVDINVFAQDASGNYIKVDTASADGLESGKSTKITFQDIEVLKSTPDDQLYVFKVDLHQAEQIEHVIQLAPDSFSMALRPAEDTRAVDTTQYGTTTDRLIMTYLYPVPQIGDLSQLMGPSPYPYPGSPNGSFTPSGSPIPGGGAPESPAPSGSPAGSPAPSASATP